MSIYHASRILARTVVNTGVWEGQKGAVGTWGGGQDLGREWGGPSIRAQGRGCCGPGPSRTKGRGMGTMRSHGRSQGLGRWSVPGAERCPGVRAAPADMSVVPATLCGRHVGRATPLEGGGAGLWRGCSEARVTEVSGGPGCFLPHLDAACRVMREPRVSSDAASDTGSAGPLVCAQHAAACKPELRSNPECQAAPAELPATLTTRDPSHPHRVNSTCQGPGPHRGDQGSGQPGLCADTHKHGHLAPAHTRVHTRARTHACPPCARAHAHTLAAALAGCRPAGDRMAVTEGPLLGGRWRVRERAHPLKPRFRLSCVRFVRTALALLSPECDSQVWVRPKFAFLFPGDACLEAILGIPLL